VQQVVRLLLCLAEGRARRGERMLFALAGVLADVIRRWTHGVELV